MDTTPRRRSALGLMAAVAAIAVLVAVPAPDGETHGLLGILRAD